MDRRHLPRIIPGLVLFGCVLLLVLRATVETPPKQSKRAQQARAVGAGCKSNLQQLGLGLILYRDAYGGGARYPDPDRMLTALFSSGVLDEHGLLICPESADVLDLEAIRQHRPGATSYDWRRTPMAYHGEFMMVWDRKVNHSGERHVLFRGGRVERMAEQSFQKLYRRMVNAQKERKRQSALASNPVPEAVRERYEQFAKQAALVLKDKIQALPAQRERLRRLARFKPPRPTGPTPEINKALAKEIKQLVGQLLVVLTQKDPQNSKTVKRLVEIGPPAVPALTEALESPFKAFMAVEVLGRIAGPAVNTLVKALSRCDRSPMPAYNPESLVRAVKRIGAPAVPALVKAFVERPVPDWQIEDEGWVSLVLVQIGPPSVPALTAALKTSPKQRHRIAHLLGRIGSSAIPMVVPLLEHPERSARSSAADILSGLGRAAQAGVPGLIRLLKEQDWWLRRKAVKALANIGPADLVAAPLIEALQDCKEVSDAAAMGLKRLAPMIRDQSLRRKVATALSTR